MSQYGSSKSDLKPDENIRSSETSLANCCGLLDSHKLPLRLKHSSHLPTRLISYYNIVDASLNEFDLTITHASPPSPRSKVVRPAVNVYPVLKDQRPQVSKFLTILLAKAYPRDTLRGKRIKVLVNPFGGKGSAPKWYHRDIEPVFRAAGCTLFVEHTRYKGHAVDIAEHLDTKAFDVVACCSGDGVPHEVFNGLAKKRDGRRALKQVAVVQLPCGTGNALSWNLNGTDIPSLAALAVVKGKRTPLDLCSVTQLVDGEEKRFLSFLSQSIGIVAESDLDTEHLRWMGDLRFTYGVLTRLFGKTTYPCDIALKVVVDSKPAIRRHCHDYNANATTINRNSQDEARALAEVEERTTNTTIGTNEDTDHIVDDPLPPSSSSISAPINTDDGWTPLTPYPTIGNFYAGKMPYVAANTNFFQAALPADGCLDLITVDGRIPRTKGLKMLAAVSEGKLFDFAEVRYRKVKAYRVVPQKKQGFISVDGERVPFVGMQVEVLASAGCVLSKRGVWEAPVLD